MASFTSNIDITNGGTYPLNITNGTAYSTIRSSLNGKMNKIQSYLQSNLPETCGTLPTSLTHGKLIIYNNQLYFGNSSNVPVQAGGGNFDDLVVKWTISMGRKADTEMGSQSTAIGSNTTADGWGSFAVGTGTTATGDFGFAAGKDSVAIGYYSFATGEETVAGHGCLTEGVNTLAASDSHAEGVKSIADGYSNILTIKSYSGSKITVEANEAINNVYQGYVGYFIPKIHRYYTRYTPYVVSSVDKNNYTITFTQSINASNYKYIMFPETSFSYNAANEYRHFTAHAEGGSTIASGPCTHAEGYCTIATNENSHSGGHYNKNMTTGGSLDNTAGDAFVIGNGTSESARSNAFRVTFAGQVYGTSSFNSSGADYAEYFEWKDGNPDDEDRVGYFVTLDNDKIRIANSNDYILGIVSGQPCVIGNADEDWLGRWQCDNFGRFIKEYLKKEKEEISTEDMTEEEINSLRKELGIKEQSDKLYRVTTNVVDYPTESWRYKANPDYDFSQEYIERKDRKEWDTIGMVGVLAVRDDGTCVPNGFCKVANNGIATATDKEFMIQNGEIIKGYRVLERVTDNIIKVLFR